MSTNNISAEEYTSVVFACAQLIALGLAYEDVFTDPMGPISSIVGKCEIGAIAECTAMTVRAQRYSKELFLDWRPD